MVSEHDNLFSAPIYVYTRDQAIADGELIDVSEIAKQAGFKISVAVTQAVWNQHIMWTDEDSNKQTIQDQSGRLWDVLWMLYIACKRSKDESYIRYGLHVVPRDGKAKKAKLTQLKAVIGGGDNGEAVITIMLPSED